MTYQDSNISFISIPSNPRFLDLTGQIFTRWLVLGYAGKLDGKNSQWWCKCLCGIVAHVAGGRLKSGRSQSCGCLKRELCCDRTRHGETRQGHLSVEYVTFHHAKNRCMNKNNKGFNRYGGRGIEFRFTSFEEFLKEIGRKPTPKHSIDRIDNNGHYEKGNVRWATAIEQGRNKRNNNIITIEGITKSIQEWDSVVSKKTVWARLKKGWCQSCAIFQPLRGHCNHQLMKNLENRLSSTPSRAKLLLLERGLTR